MAYSPRLYRMRPWLVRVLIPPHLPGSYTLYKFAQGSAKPIYVGRSDTDLQRRLITHPLVGVATHFEYDVHDSAGKAYIVECTLYHMFEGLLKNKIHPAMPAGVLLNCPFCHARETLNNRLDGVS